MTAPHQGTAYDPTLSQDVPCSLQSSWSSVLPIPAPSSRGWRGRWGQEPALQVVWLSQQGWMGRAPLILCRGINQAKEKWEPSRGCQAEQRRVGNSANGTEAGGGAAEVPGDGGEFMPKESTVTGEYPVPSAGISWWPLDPFLCRGTKCK